MKTLLTTLALVIAGSTVSANDLCKVTDKYEDESFKTTWVKVKTQKKSNSISGDIVMRSVSNVNWKIGDTLISTRQCEQISNLIKKFSDITDEEELMAKTVVYMSKRNDKFLHQSAMRLALNTTIESMEMLVAVTFNFKDKEFGKDPL